MNLEDMIRAIVREELAKSKPDTAPPFLSIAEAADFARVSPGTVRRWVAAKKLTRFEAGARVLVDRAELDALLRREAAPVDIELSPEARARKRLG